MVNYLLARKVHDFSAVDINGQEVPLDRYRGNVVLIVNVNYEQLVELDKRYRERGLRILGFPCNQFAGQEPKSNEEIKEFITKYGVEFDMFDKVDVNGANAHPLFVYLKKKLPGFLLDAVKWNFTKFLVDRQGNPVKRYGPKEDPFTLIPDIEGLLDESV
ncbi:glutathione peroxidase-like protein [Thamnocephalis sphaerospora]|uniref:Glutathione peroxidase-like protein n=1 Tax=Thamnocephalis sphaerospora TaxID=78915 RepID=A0A4P9XIK5_9FUNG|nr:glutathione peroxidase-like protein [Thamnocephalis sphaerospora]|eukprot:RKP05536.1 glutathione peroxidase-like protein [Thamnocephalis sphaerospora]